jgi:hypothetical protein
MAAIAKQASVDFVTRSILVQEGDDKRVTDYRSQNYEQLMLIQIIALRRMGFTVYFKNRIALLEWKLMNLEGTVSFDDLSKSISNLGIK